MNDLENLENLENNEKIGKSNYKKLLWIIAVLNIIFLLAIFGLNFACYNALESKCPDNNIQLSNNSKPLKDKKEVLNTGSIVDSLNSLGYPNYVFNSVIDTDIQDFLDSDFSIKDNFNLNGYYNWFINIYFDFEYTNYTSYNTEPFIEIQSYFYDVYYDNGRNDYYDYDYIRPYSYDTGEFWNSEGNWRRNTNCSLSSLTQGRTISNYYDNTNPDNDYYFELEFTTMEHTINFDITEYRELTFLMYFVPVGDSSGGSYEAGYDKGYQDGLMNTDVYQYAEEYYNNGFNAGFQEGIQQGIEESGNNILGNMLLTIFDVPLMYLSSLLNFNLLGINLLGLLGAIISLGLIIFLIKKLL